jgi:hypothetical protein
MLLKGLYGQRVSVSEDISFEVGPRERVCVMAVLVLRIEARLERVAG